MAWPPAVERATARPTAADDDRSADPTRLPAILDRVRVEVRQRHYSLRTAKSYAGWVRRFVAFHRYRDPAALGASDIRTFLTHLAVDLNVSASTQNQAFSALLFLFREILGQQVEGLNDTPRAKGPVRLPLVLTRSEIRRILDRLRGRLWLIASLMYGGGLRLEECLGLRVKDVDLGRRVLVVRDGKGRRDAKPSFRRPCSNRRRQIDWVRRQHEKWRSDGHGAVTLPDALERKYPRAAWELGWQWVFPAAREYVDARIGVLRRHHLHATAVQRAFRAAVAAAGIAKPATTHTLRHYAGSRIMPSTWLGASLCLGSGLSNPA